MSINKLYEMVLENNFKVKEIECLWKVFNRALTLTNPGLEEKEMPLYVEICGKYHI